MRKFYKLLQNKMFIFGGIIFLLFLGVVEFRQYKMRANVQKEINDLSKQADQIQKNNVDLQNLISYLKTDSYKEKAAREQLSLKKPGETVYSFAPQGASQAQPAATDAQQAQSSGNSGSNLQSWWNYFFRPSQ